jgi:hypothetical protein
MGFLVSFTLLVALFSNLLLLPSLLLSLDQWLTTRKFEEPLIELFEENEETEVNGDELPAEEIKNEVEEVVMIDK